MIYNEIGRKRSKVAIATICARSVIARVPWSLQSTRHRYPNRPTETCSGLLENDLSKVLPILQLGRTFWWADNIYRGWPLAPVKNQRLSTGLLPETAEIHTPNLHVRSFCALVHLLQNLAYAKDLAIMRRRCIAGQRPKQGGKKEQDSHYHDRHGVTPRSFAQPARPYYCGPPSSGRDRCCSACCR